MLIFIDCGGILKESESTPKNHEQRRTKSV